MLGADSGTAGHGLDASLGPLGCGPAPLCCSSAAGAAFGALAVIAACAAAPEARWAPPLGVRAEEIDGVCVCRGWPGPAREGFRGNFSCWKSHSNGLHKQAAFHCTISQIRHFQSLNVAILRTAWRLSKAASPAHPAPLLFWKPLGLEGTVGLEQHRECPDVSAGHGELGSAGLCLPQGHPGDQHIFCL